jgi:hypothetical protein
MGLSAVIEIASCEVLIYFSFSAIIAHLLNPLFSYKILTHLEALMSYDRAVIRLSSQNQL